MPFIMDVLADAFDYLTDFGPDLRSIIVLTLVVSLTATVIGCAIGIPIGIRLATARFRGRPVVITLVNVGMGMPPVLAGLLVLLLVWGRGPLGSLGLVFTPWAMIMVQALLAFPIAIGVTMAAVGNLSVPVLEQVRALDLTRLSSMRLLASEARSGVLTAVAAAFGRVIAEVGAVLIVGGNIAGHTQVLTTAIVEQSRQARFGAAVALGIILLVISVIVNAGLTWLQGWERPSG